MRDTPENREFPQPWLKKPREAGQKTEPMTCPLRHGQPPQTGLPQHPGACEGVRTLPVLPGRRERSRTQTTLQITPRPNADRRPRSLPKNRLKNPPSSGLLLCPCPKRLREPTVFPVRRAPPRCNINIWSRTATSAYRSKLPCPPPLSQKILPVCPVFPALFLH